MRPVPSWVGQAVLPWHGETFTDYWGPIETSVGGRTVTGTLVLSNHRLLFLKAGARSVAEATLEFARPLNQLERVVGEHRNYEGRLIVDRCVFSFRETAPGAAELAVGSMVSTLTAARQARLAELHAPPAAPPTLREREIIREIVKVPCRYCGSLVEVTSTKCSACGATLRAT